MRKVKFFIEGKADKKFLQDYLFFLKRIKLSDTDFIVIGSNNEEAIKNRKNEFVSNIDNGGINLMMFDADSDLSATKSELERINTSLGINCNLFLFPNNNDNGQLEHLLIDIVPDENRAFFDCFDSFENCLKNDNRFSFPVLKSKIFAYIDSLLTKKEKKHRVNFAGEEFRDYTDDRFWNLEHPSLNMLKDFLGKYF